MTENPRSCLSVPGSSEPMVAKALASAADEVVIDLEDAVSPGAKDHARSCAIAALGSAAAGRRVAVRVNGVGTPWCHQDLIALAGAPVPPASIVLPKAESAGDLAFAERLLLGAGAPAVPVQALIESAAGLRAVDEIAASASVEALVIGYADLAASLGRELTSASWDSARERVLWAARAAGVRAVDGPHLGTTLDEAFAASLDAAVASGYDAKWVIHPAQLHAVNQAFSPTPAQVAWARRVLDALREAEHEGRGAVALEGTMLDEAVALGARRVLARASA